MWPCRHTHDHWSIHSSIYPPDRHTHIHTHIHTHVSIHSSIYIDTHTNNTHCHMLPIHSCMWTPLIHLCPSVNLCVHPDTQAHSYVYPSRQECIPYFLTEVLYLNWWHPRWPLSQPVGPLSWVGKQRWLGPWRLLTCTLVQHSDVGALAHWSIGILPSCLKLNCSRRKRSFVYLGSYRESRGRAVPGTSWELCARQ
jgi:hypothetical protein